jgi:hypothetical protein
MMPASDAGTENLQPVSGSQLYIIRPFLVSFTIYMLRFKKWTRRTLDTILRRSTLYPKSVLKHVILSEEPLEKHEPGSYYPVNIGDNLDRTRYTIIRKLGWGRYSTMWLAV